MKNKEVTHPSESSETLEDFARFNGTAEVGHSDTRRFTDIKNIHGIIEAVKRNLSLLLETNDPKTIAGFLGGIGPLANKQAKHKFTLLNTKELNQLLSNLDHKINDKHTTIELLANTLEGVGYLAKVQYINIEKNNPLKTTFLVNILDKINKSVNFETLIQSARALKCIAELYSNNLLNGPDSEQVKSKYIDLLTDAINLIRDENNKKVHIGFSTSLLICCAFAKHQFKHDLKWRNCVPEKLQNDTKKTIGTNLTSSNTQTRAYEYIKHVTSTTKAVITCEKFVCGYNIDIAIEHQSKKIAIEIDGHFHTKGTEKLRDYILTSEGWNIIHVDISRPDEKDNLYSILQNILSTHKITPPTGHQGTRPISQLFPTPFGDSKKNPVSDNKSSTDDIKPRTFNAKYTR